MPFFSWSADLSVGINEIDEEHKNCIAYINRLHDAIETRGSCSDLCGILREAQDYFKGHFQREEKMFLKTDYPDANKHILLHKEFLKELGLFRELCSSETANTLVLETLLAFKKWLINHVQEMDAFYVPYVNAKGLHI